MKPSHLAAFALLLAVAACEKPDRSGIEDVFLERETTPGTRAYDAVRDQAYHSLTREGPTAALPLFQMAYKSPGAGNVSFELLPIIARLEVLEGDRATAATHLRTARLAQSVSLGETVCQGSGSGVFKAQEGKFVPAFEPEDLGSALLVSTTLCATRDVYPKRPRTGADDLFDRKFAAVETLLAGTSEALSPKP